MNLHRKTRFEDLGHMEYKTAWDYQEQLLRKLQSDVLSQNYASAENYLLFVEHPQVYTLGLHGNAGNLLIQPDFLQRIGATFYHTNRGGDITYHGPGQIVGYPILYLDAFCKGIRQYIFLLEESVIRTLSLYGLRGERLEGATGVWLDAGNSSARKICAIGVRASRGITMHGFAFNVNTDLRYFGYINPCGFTDKGVTSMQKELGRPMDFDEVKTHLRMQMAEVFGMDFV
ncbi:MAG: lipoyl(octanoyl) transferase LipB [Bacteroidales bacterium]